MVNHVYLKIKDEVFVLLLGYARLMVRLSWMYGFIMLFKKK